MNGEIEMHMSDTWEQMVAVMKDREQRLFLHLPSGELIIHMDFLNQLWLNGHEVNLTMSESRFCLPFLQSAFLRHPQGVLEVHHFLVLSGFIHEDWLVTALRFPSKQAIKRHSCDINHKLAPYDLQIARIGKQLYCLAILYESGIAS